MNIAFFLVICWIIIVVILWVVFRNKRPDLLGLSDDISRQKIDKTEFIKCPECNNGFLEPQFPWWKYSIGMIILPFGVYIIGKPDHYFCRKCNSKIYSIKENGWFTRISLTYFIRKPLLIAWILNILIAIVIFSFYFFE